TWSLVEGKRSDTLCFGSHLAGQWRAYNNGRIDSFGCQYVIFLLSSAEGQHGTRRQRQRQAQSSQVGRQHIHATAFSFYASSETLPGQPRAISQVHSNIVHLDITQLDWKRQLYLRHVSSRLLSCWLGFLISLAFADTHLRPID